MDIDKEFQLNLHNEDKASEWIHNLLNESPYHILSAKNPTIGKWSMSRLWFSWMESTGKFMASQGITQPLMITQDGKQYGSRPFNKNDAYELFSSKLLSDGNGDRLSWSKAGREDRRAATRGERVFAMQRHEQWMIERGIRYLNPKDSDYLKAIGEQEK